jgi:Arc/MetJ-type ribon-helix-helix transcriptional regulator
MTKLDTMYGLPDRAISVRLDDRAQRALDELVASGVSQSEAIRAALVEAAHRRRTELLAEEARRVAADPKDRAEKAEILAVMDSLRPKWPAG